MEGLYPDASPSGGGELAPEFAAAKERFQQAGRQDLCDWVDRELSGYPQGSRLPPYRHVPAVARGTVTRDEERLDNHRLPVWHLAGDWTHEPLRQGLAQIEAWAGSSEPCLLQSIHPHQHALFTRGLRLGGGHAVTEAWWEIRTEDLSSVVLAGAREQLHRALRTLQSFPGGQSRGDATP